MEWIYKVKVFSRGCFLTTDIRHLTTEKIATSHKPDPVTHLHVRPIIYLSRHLRTGLNLPTLYRARPKPVLSEPLSTGTIRGISACKVYPRMMLPS